MSEVWVIDRKLRPYTAVPVEVVRDRNVFREKDGQRVFKEDCRHSAWWWKTESDAYEHLVQTAQNSVDWHEHQLELAKDERAVYLDRLEGCDK